MSTICFLHLFDCERLDWESVRVGASSQVAASREKPGLCLRKHSPGIRIHLSYVLGPAIKSDLLGEWTSGPAISQLLAYNANHQGDDGPGYSQLAETLVHLSRIQKYAT
jgi:hypothetical protein